MSTYPTCDPETSVFRATKSKGCKTKTTGTRSARRRRTEPEAIALLDGAKGLSGMVRRHAVVRVRDAKQPVAEARRIVDHLAREAAAGIVQGDAIDFSDVQELRVKIIRRDRILDQPQAMLLARMDRKIALEGMTKTEFGRFAAILFSAAMKCCL